MVIRSFGTLHCIWQWSPAQRPALRRHGRRHWGWRGARWGRGGVSCRRFFPLWAEADWLEGWYCTLILELLDDMDISWEILGLNNHCCDSKWPKDDNSFLVNLFHQNWVMMRNNYISIWLELCMIKYMWWLQNNCRHLSILYQPVWEGFCSVFRTLFVLVFFSSTLL